MNGPAVNWKILELFDEKLESKDLPKTLNIGSYKQHSVHGALKMGMKSVDWNVEKILKSMFWILQRMTTLEKDKQLFSLWGTYIIFR